MYQFIFFEELIFESETNKKIGIQKQYKVKIYLLSL